MTTNQTIDGVPREFVREGRYIVVKPDYEDDIRTERLRNYIEEMCFHTPDCVVVEADWPEYEPVWRMIEARVIGNPTELDAVKATISQLQGLVAELRALLYAEQAPCAKSQVEPTGEMEEAGCQAYMDAEGMIGIMHRSSMGHAYRAMRALEQPAPVAVVMPERREIGPNHPYLSDLDIEWNACLDEVTRLNPSL